MEDTLTGAQLAALLKADRVKRRMRWKPYATWLGVKMSTLQKIVRGVTEQPQELTVAALQERLAIPYGKEAENPPPGASPDLTGADLTDQTI